jgi:hypothetical protein
MRRDLNGRFRERVGIDQTTDYGQNFTSLNYA